MKSMFARVFSRMFEKTDKKIIMKRVEDVFDYMEKTTAKMVKIPTDIGKDTQLSKNLDMRFSSRGTPVKGYEGNVIAYVRKTTNSVLENKEGYMKLFDEAFKRDAFKESLDYRQITLLTLAVSLDEFSKYASRLMLMLTKLETGTSLKPADKEMLEYCLERQQLDAFARICNALQTKPSDVNQLMSKLKDVSYNADDEELIRKMRGDAIDPLKMGLIPVVGDAFLMMGELYNIYRKSVYDYSVEEVAKLELQVLYLERAKSGADESELARIQKQIDYHTGRIGKLNARIEDLEEDAKDAGY